RTSVVAPIVPGGGPQQWCAFSSACCDRHAFSPGVIHCLPMLNVDDSNVNSTVTVGRPRIPALCSTCSTVTSAIMSCFQWLPRQSTSTAPLMWTPPAYAYSRNTTPGSKGQVTLRTPSVAPGGLILLPAPYPPGSSLRCQSNTSIQPSSGL